MKKLLRVLCLMMVTVFAMAFLACNDQKENSSSESSIPKVDTYTVTIVSNEESYGTVSLDMVENVVSGAMITVEDNKLTVGSTEIIATPTADTAEYTYDFVGWDAPATITEDTTIVAEFKRTYIMSEDLSSAMEILKNSDSYYEEYYHGYASEWVADANNLTVSVYRGFGGVGMTLTPSAIKALFDLGYQQMSFVLSVDTQTYCAVFIDGSLNFMTGHVKTDNGFGSPTYYVESGTEVTLDLFALVSDSNFMNKVPDENAGGLHFVVLDSAQATAQYTRPAKIMMQDVQFSEVSAYTVSIAVNNENYGSVNLNKVENVAAGTTITVDGNKLMVGGTEIIATPVAADDKYTYEFIDWNTPEMVMGHLTITANFQKKTAKVNKLEIATTTGDFARYLGHDGLNNDYLDSNMQALDLLYEAGFRYVDLSMYYFTGSGEFMQSDWRESVEELGAYAQSLGMTFVQAHSQSGNPLDTNSGSVDWLVRCTLRQIEICGVLGIENIVVHHGWRSGFTKEQSFAANKAFYERLLPTAAECGVNILTENSTKVNMGANYYLGTGAEMREFIEYVNHPNFHGCWDTGHAKCDGEQYDDILTLGEHLYGIHFADTTGYSDSHTMPFFGVLDEDEVMTALIDVGYDGYFTLECDGSARINGTWSGPNELAYYVGSTPSELTRMQQEKLLYASVQYLLNRYDMLAETEYSVEIKVINPSFGTVDVEPLTGVGVPYGTDIVVNGNSLMIGGMVITATPQNDCTFAGWDVPAKIMGNLIIEAKFLSPTGGDEEPPVLEPEEQAFAILANADSYQSHYHGAFKNVKVDNGNITVTAGTYNSSFIGFAWKKAMVQELIDLGNEKVTFTLTTNAGGYVCVEYGSAGAVYVQSGESITINLADVAEKAWDDGLKFIFTSADSWNASTATSVTFSNIQFDSEGSTETPDDSIEGQSFAILANADSYQSHYHGAFKSVKAENGNITVTAGTYNSSFIGFAWKKAMVQELIDLGNEKVTFTMTTNAGGYVCVEYGSAGAVYVQSGESITINLVDVAEKAWDDGLKFVFTSAGSWTASTATSVTFSNIQFDSEGSTETPDDSIEGQSFAILANADSYQSHYHGAFKSVKAENGNITVTAGTYNSSFIGFAWKKAMVQELIDLGNEKVTFTMTTNAGGYVCVEYGSAGAVYVQSGESITINLVDVAEKAWNDDGLKFVFTSAGSWTASTATSVTFSNIQFDSEGSTETPDDSIEGQALAILANADSYQSHYHGAFKGVKSENGNITVTAGTYSSSFNGFGWKKTAVQNLIALGVKSVTFTVETDTNEYVCIYGGASSAFLIGKFTPSSTGGYVQSGTQITIDLLAVVEHLGEEGLKFGFTSVDSWTASTATSVTFSNIQFASEGSAETPDDSIEGQALAILTNADSYQSHYHGAFKGVKAENGNITVTAGTYNSNMTGFGWKKTAVQSLIALGVKSVTFTMTTDVEAYVDVYGGGVDTVYITGDLTDTGESHYVKSGTQITIDLIAVVDHLGEEGLKFVFTNADSWTASTATSVTYSNITFA